MKMKITEKGIKYLKSNISYWIMKEIYKEVCITQEQWDNMTNEEKEKLLNELRNDKELEFV